MRKNKSNKKHSSPRNPSKNTIKKLHRGDPKELPGRSHIKTNYDFYNWIGARAYIISKGKINNINNEGFEKYIPKGNKYKLVSFIYYYNSKKCTITFRSRNIISDFFRFNIPIEERTTIIIHHHRTYNKKIVLTLETILTYGAMMVLTLGVIQLLQKLLFDELNTQNKTI